MPVEAPELALQDLSGSLRQLSSFRNQQIVVLNFWATWCAPCRQEMPLLVAVQKLYADKGVQVIGASADHESTRDQIPAFVRKAKINFPIWVGATTDDMAKFGVGRALPATIIIDRDGRIAARIIGVIKKGDLESRIEWLLSDRSTPAPEATLNPADDHRHDDSDEHQHGEVGVQSASTVPS